MHSSRRFLIVFLAFLASAAVVRSAAAAQAYLIADAQTGYILEEQEPRKKLQVGSLTKIATASVVLDWSERNPAISIEQWRFRRRRFKAPLKTTLAFNRVTPSLCAIFSTLRLCSLTISRPTRSRTTSVRSWNAVEAGSKLTPVDMFVAQMNALAKQLKMDRTRFVNPHGIDYKVKPLPYSTAEDMARLTRYAMNKPASVFMCRKRNAKFHSIARVKAELHASQHKRTPGKDGHRRSQDRSHSAIR